jgi:hypothetical protein
MAQANPSHLEGGDWEDHSSRPAQGKSSQDSMSTSGWAWWQVPIIPAMQGSTNRSILALCGQGIK